MYKHMGKDVIKILQGSAVTLTMLGGLTIHPSVANVLQYICARNYENWLAVDKVIAKIIRLTFFWPTLYCLGLVFTGSYIKATQCCLTVPPYGLFSVLLIVTVIV